jgi:hypothetical protein
MSVRRKKQSSIQVVEAALSIACESLRERRGQALSAQDHALLRIATVCWDTARPGVDFPPDLLALYGLPREERRR